jgi:hypothetical protein
MGKLFEFHTFFKPTVMNNQTISPLESFVPINQETNVALG